MVMVEKDYLEEFEDSCSRYSDSDQSYDDQEDDDDDDEEVFQILSWLKEELSQNTTPVR